MQESESVKLKGGGIGSPKWRAANRPATMPTNPEDENEPLTPEELALLDACETPEEAAQLVSSEAMETIIRIMRKPGRHAQTQLAAARELMAYGVKKPVERQETKVEGALEIIVSRVEK